MKFIVWSFIYDCAQAGLCWDMKVNHFVVKHLIKYPDDYHYVRRTQDMTYVFSCALLVFLTGVEISQPSLPFWIVLPVWLIDSIGVICLISWTNRSLKKSFKYGVNHIASKKAKKKQMRGKHFK